MDTNDIQDFCYNLIDCSWFDCYKSFKRNESIPSWKPYCETNNQSKIKEIYKKCNNCCQTKKVTQVCNLRGNNLYFCCSNCWEEWIENFNQIKHDERDSEDFII